jgi:uncharacterized glyoxalase superfamily protein PhnB
MANPAKPIPEGYHTVTPGLTCKNAAQAIEFYKKAFGAQEIASMPSPDGQISHAELRIGDSVIFLNDEFPGMCAAPSQSVPSTSLFLYVANADSTFNQAVAAGATPTMPVQNMFWGDRYGKVVDPFGHHWGIATHIEDVALDEMERRATAFFTNLAKAAGQS